MFPSITSLSFSTLVAAEVDSIDFFDWILHLVAVDSFTFEFHGIFSSVP